LASCAQLFYPDIAGDDMPIRYPETICRNRAEAWGLSIGKSASVSRAFLIAFCAGSFALAGVMMLFLPETDG
jgi:hypothetical protein